MSKKSRVQVYFSVQDLEYLAKVKAETGESKSQIVKRILNNHKRQESIITNHIIIPSKCCETCFNKFNDACKRCDKVMHKFEHISE